VIAMEITKTIIPPWKVQPGDWIEVADPSLDEPLTVESVDISVELSGDSGGISSSGTVTVHHKFGKVRLETDALVYRLQIVGVRR